MGMKDAYHQKADAQLREWQVWIEQIKLGAGKRTAKRPEDHLRSVERLEDCHRIARVRLSELYSSSEARWEYAKQAVEQAMIDLKNAFDESGVDPVGRYVQLQPDRSHVFEPFHYRKG